MAELTMDNVTVKDVQKLWDGLVAVKLADKKKLPKDLDEALEVFREQMESIPNDEVKKGGNRAIKAHNAAMDLYEILPEEGELPEAEEEEEEPEAEEEEAEPEEEEPETEAEEEEEAEAEAEPEDDEEEEPVAAKAKKGGAKAAPKKADNKAAPKKDEGKAKTPAKAAPKKEAKAKGPGVVSTILECLKGAKKSEPVTKEDIHKVLKKTFKDRDPDKMMVSINTVVTPKEVERLWGLNLQVDKSERPWKYWLKK